MEIRYGKNHSVHNLLFLSYLLNVDQIVCMEKYTFSLYMSSLHIDFILQFRN